MSAALKIGILISAIGLALTGVSAYYAKDEIKNFDKYTSGKIELTDVKKLSLDSDASVVTFHKTDSEKSYINYNLLEFYDIKTDENNNVEISRKKKYMILAFSFMWNNKSTVDVYLNSDDYKTTLELDAGKIIMDDNMTFESFSLEMSAGSFDAKNITVTGENETNIKLSAGDVDIEKLDCQKTSIRLSAGDLDIKELNTDIANIKLSAGDVDIDKFDTNNLTFKLSAGSMKCNLVGSEDDYSFAIDKSAGSCNVKSKIGGSKKVEGKLSAGSVRFNFGA